MKLHLLYLTGCCLLLTTFCCTSPTSLNQLDQLDQRIVMSKGPCFGNCPVYTLTVYDNGLAVYEGERNVEKRGIYARKLKQPELQRLFTAFREARLFRFDNIYKATLPDLSTVTLTWVDDEGEEKTIVGKDNRPREVMELEGLLDELAAGDGWEAKEVREHDLPAGAIDNQLIVQLAEQVKPDVWVIQYAKQNMAIVERISPNSNYYVVSFNAEVMPPREMLEWVRRDPYVMGAEFNKEGSMRNGGR